MSDWEIRFDGTLSNVLIATKEVDTFKLVIFLKIVSYVEGDKWFMAMYKEMEYLQKNKTWELVKPPRGNIMLDAKVSSRRRSLKCQTI